MHIRYARQLYQHRRVDAEANEDRAIRLHPYVVGRHRYTADGRVHPFRFLHVHRLEIKNDPIFVRRCDLYSYTYASVSSFTHDVDMFDSDTSILAV